MIKHILDSNPKDKCISYAMVNAYFMFLMSDYFQNIGKTEIFTHY